MSLLTRYGHTLAFCEVQSLVAWTALKAGRTATSHGVWPPTKRSHWALTATLLCVEHLWFSAGDRAALALTATLVKNEGRSACDSAVTVTGAGIELAWSEAYEPFAARFASTIQFILDTQPFYSNWKKPFEADGPHKSCDSLLRFTLASK